VFRFLVMPVKTPSLLVAEKSAAQPFKVVPV
jgi:hypothetical protein